MVSFVYKCSRNVCNLALTNCFLITMVQDYFNTVNKVVSPVFSCDTLFTIHVVLGEVYL